WAPLARRCRALARHPLTLPPGLDRIGPGENCCPPHASRSDAGVTTPAVAAGITAHGGTVRERLSLHGPLSRWAPPQRRGRPARGPRPPPQRGWAFHRG